MSVPNGCMTIGQVQDTLGWSRYLVRWCMHEGFLKTKVYYVDTKQGKKRAKAIRAESVEELRVRILKGDLKGMV